MRVTTSLVMPMLSLGLRTTRMWSPSQCTFPLATLTRPMSASFPHTSSVDKLLGIPHTIIFAHARLLQLTTQLSFSNRAVLHYRDRSSCYVKITYRQCNMSTVVASHLSCQNVGKAAQVYYSRIWLIRLLLNCPRPSLGQKARCVYVNMIIVTF